jgi:hypothetical protein
MYFQLCSEVPYRGQRDEPKTIFTNFFIIEKCIEQSSNDELINCEDSPSTYVGRMAQRKFGVTQQKK